MKNIILIGMPGAGKSTVGVVLAKKLGYAFMDADLVIQAREGKLLHEIISEQGVEGFWQVEEEVNESILTERTVIEDIRERLGDLDERGVTLREGQDLAALYEERIPLYEKYADITINCGKMSIREVVEKIVTLTGCMVRE